MAPEAFCGGPGGAALGDHRFNGDGFLDRVEVLPVDVLAQQGVQEPCASIGDFDPDQGVEAIEGDMSGSPVAALAVHQDALRLPDLPFMLRMARGNDRQNRRGNGGGMA